MTTLRRFTCNDLFNFNGINLDPLTETYNYSFYLEYLAKWPEYCQMAVGPGQSNMGYVLGKVEGQDKLWHGHVTAVTVAPDCRRLGLASKLMDILEQITDKVHFAALSSLVVDDGEVRGVHVALRAHGAIIEMELPWHEAVKAVHNAYFVDLFVRASNDLAIGMYRQLGYSTYRRVLGYYSGQEDALDMRKAMPRDVRKESVVPLKHPVRVEDLEFD